MTNIRVSFNYNLQDDYVSGTWDLKRSASYVYEGPDKIWVFVDDQGEIYSMNWFSEEEGGPELETPEGYTKIEIDCAGNPLVSEIIGSNNYDWDRDTQEMIVVDLPNGETYEYPKYPEPNHTYDTGRVTYDFENNDWILYPFENWKTWDDIITSLNTKKELANEKFASNTDWPEDMRSTYSDYISKLDTFLDDWADIPVMGVRIPDDPFE